jgi:predicted O-linked N-acetylglucosamine transferase (SPINDLY family)
MTPPETFDQARAAHRQGNLALAESLYRRALGADPANAAAWYLLGVACHGRGNLGEAERALGEAVRRQPAHADAWNHLGVVLAAAGKLEEPVHCFLHALRARPDFPDARKNLALARGNPAVGPLVATLMTQAGGHEAQGRLDAARDCYQRASALRPDSAPLCRQLGIVLGKLGRLDEAVATLRQAVALQPDFAEAYQALGAALHHLGRRAEAADAYRAAIRIKPELPGVHSNLGDILAKAGDLDAAAESYRRAIAVRPDFPPAHNNLGSVLSELGRLADAVASYRHALRLKPDFLDAQSNLLKAINYDPAGDPATLLAEHRRWRELYGPVTGVGPGPAPGHDRDPDRPLRVGYVSPDFRTHAVAYFFEPILAHHDRARFEPFCYAEVAAPDATTARLQGLAAAWRPTVGQTDAQVAEQVRRDRVDILVDLAGHTSGHRLGVFARRPAPVQVTYLGYPNTTGLPEIDYLFTDAVVDPPGEPPWSTEEPYRLPAPFCCYAPPAGAPAVGPSPAARNGYVTFGSLHKLSKLNGAVLDLWCDLLGAVPSARLLLFRNNLTGSRRDEVRRHFLNRGIAEERVALRHDAGPAGYLGVYHGVDVSLDVFPWCGHTTACESLWMGVPVITLLGDRHAGRMTASVLDSLGLGDWVARTPGDYVATARRAAGGAEDLGSLRAGLRERMARSPLCDGPGQTARLEDAFRTVWRRRCDGEHGAGARQPRTTR